MTIDEAIECEKQHRLYPEYHKQIAELLEELKVYRDNERVYDQQYDIGYDKGYDKGFYEGYNKAIDKFVKKLKEHDSTCNFDWEYYDEIAEQLKERE